PVGLRRGADPGPPPRPGAQSSDPTVSSPSTGACWSPRPRRAATRRDRRARPADDAGGIPCQADLRAWQAAARKEGDEKAWGLSDIRAPWYPFTDRRTMVEQRAQPPPGL